MNNSTSFYSNNRNFDNNNTLWDKNNTNTSSSFYKHQLALENHFRGIPDKRFDVYPSIRNQKNHKELMVSSNIGPGSYDVKFSQRPHTVSLVKSNLQSSIIRKSSAPPPGTYEIPRIMTPAHPGSELGIRISSPFKSSGRRRDLMDDAEHYVTLRESEKMSNLGPGSYETIDNWSPTYFKKYNRSESILTNKFYSQPLPSNRQIKVDKPWRSNSKKYSSSSNNEQCEGELNSAEFEIRKVKKELERDISSVRQLPDL
eukprot:gene8030-10879_t